MADLQAPSFDDIQRETGPFTRAGVNLIWTRLVKQPSGNVIQMLRDILEPKVTQAALGANTNDLQIGHTSVLQLTGGSSVNLTGIQCPDPNKARLLLVVNTGAGTITLLHESASSQANNRLHSKSGGSIVLATDAATVLLYLSSRYRQVA